MGNRMRPHLGDRHGAVALVVSKLGLLVGRDGERRVVQLWKGPADGPAEDLLQPLVDVGHGLTAGGGIFLQTLHRPRHTPSSRVWGSPCTAFSVQQFLQGSNIHDMLRIWVFGPDQGLYCEDARLLGLCFCFVSTGCDNKVDSNLFK